MRHKCPGIGWLEVGDRGRLPERQKVFRMAASLLLRERPVIEKLQVTRCTQWKYKI
jgi:hypothetical protein